MKTFLVVASLLASVVAAQADKYTVTNPYGYSTRDPDPFIRLAFLKDSPPYD